MVLGTPTTLAPAACSLLATPRVSSPPIATSASTPRLDRFSLIRSRPDRPPALAASASGLVRDDPRIVPPRGRMPRTACTSRTIVSPSSGPRQPSRKPMNSKPCSAAPVRTTARITAFRPGQSPPPVRTPTRIDSSSSVLLARHTSAPEGPPGPPQAGVARTRYSMSWLAAGRVMRMPRAVSFACRRMVYSPLGRRQVPFARVDLDHNAGLRPPGVGHGDQPAADVEAGVE